MNDEQLLRAYAKERSEGAFRLLVDRYVRLVYGACWRQLRDRHLAEDATQGVFVLLSQKAGRLRRDRLAGWLLTAARYACANMRKVQRRRERREEVAAMREELRPDGAGEELLGMLDEGLGRLGAVEREAVVLRYLQEQPLREVGEALGISEEAARKRVDRAVEKLRQHFERGGVQTSSAMVVAVLVGQASGGGMTAAVQEAITQGILGACHGGAASGGAVGIAEGVRTMMLMAKVKAAAVTVAVVAAVGVGAGWLAMSPGVGGESVVVAADAATRPVVATTRAVEEVVIDRSTPEKAMESFCRAMKAGDRNKVYLCLDVDPKRQTMPFDATLRWCMAQNRLIRATAGAFGTTGEEAREMITIDDAGRMMLAAFRLAGKTAVIEGESAKLTLEVPEALMRLLPEESQQLITVWSGQVLRFQKQGDAWLLDIDHLMRQKMTLVGGPGQADREVEDAATQVALMEGLAEAAEETAADLEAGRMKTWGEASGAWRTRQLRTLERFGNYVGVNTMAVPGDEWGGGR